MEESWNINGILMAIWQRNTNGWLVVWSINFIFPYIGNNTPNGLMFFRGVETTNQMECQWNINGTLMEYWLIMATTEQCDPCTPGWLMIRRNYLYYQVPIADYSIIQVAGEARTQPTRIQWNARGITCGHCSWKTMGFSHDIAGKSALKLSSQSHLRSSFRWQWKIPPKEIIDVP